MPFYFFKFSCLPLFFFFFFHFVCVCFLFLLCVGLLLATFSAYVILSSRCFHRLAVCRWSSQTVSIGRLAPSAVGRMSLFGRLVGRVSQLVWPLFGAVFRPQFLGRSAARPSIRPLPAIGCLREYIRLHVHPPPSVVTVSW